MFIRVEKEYCFNSTRSMFVGMAVEQDDNDTDFRNHFPQDLLESRGVNFTALLDEDLRCGGTVRATNLTSNKIKILAQDCMVQRCSFR